MPLELITGPANAAKAGAVLDAVRAARSRGPLLVVPTAADADRYRRELVAGGAVVGVKVMVFQALLETIDARAGLSSRRDSHVVRQQVAAVAVDNTAGSGRLGAVAHTAGLAGALVRFADELDEQRITPQRLTAALRTWAAGDESRTAYAEALSGLVVADAGLRGQHGHQSGAALVTAALDVLRTDPGRWAGTPVFLYGFDDLGALQLDVVETLSGPVGADVVVGLTFEAGRSAFAARATLHQRLLGHGARERVLPAQDDHYSAGSRATLHHIERNLFEPAAARAGTAAGVRALAGGSERAEFELAAAEIAARIKAGTAPDEIAVVHRDLETRGPLIARALESAGVPTAWRHEVGMRESAIGRALLGLLRAALPGGDADDLLVYLRAPGLLADAGLADRFEVELRCDGVRTADEALERWQRRHGELRSVTLLSGAASAARRTGLRPLAKLLDREAQWLMNAPGRGNAPRLDGPLEAEARIVAGIRRALAELADLTPEIQPRPDRLEALLAGIKVQVGARPGPGRVTIAHPQDLRARRVRVLYCLGMLDGVFPRPATPESFLGDDERREINIATGLGLRLHEDALDIERLFFYAAVSRPTEELVVGWHDADDDGAPKVRSLLLDDLFALLPEGFEKTARVRAMGVAGWPPAEAPTEREARRHKTASGPRRAPETIAPLRDQAALAPLAERHTWSASGLEAWISCPVRWFVERHLRPSALVPDPEPLLRGDLAHRVLERVIRELAEGEGGLPGSDPGARRRIVADVMRDERDARQLSVNPERLRTELHRLELDLVAYVDRAAASGSTFTPSRFEVGFGRAEDLHLPLELGEPGELPIAGRIDRIDVSGREAIIYDYKGRAAPPRPQRWVEDGKIQLALYVLAVRELLDLDPVGAFYQPLGGSSDGRPRGALLEDSDPGLETKGNDRVGEAEFEELLAAAADLARTAADDLRSGALHPAPEQCTPDGCAHPTICRCLPG